MKSKGLRLMLCVALLVSAIATVIVATPAAATATTSLQITRWGSGNTILFQETISYTDMGSRFAVQGDGTTHYWLEGPNYPPFPDMWDPDETGNLKDKGALKGTDLKDLCIWAGETAGQVDSATTIKLSCTQDGFYNILPYDNVYNPPAVQGPAVVCWWMNGDYTGHGSFTSGMRLVFFAQEAKNDKYTYGDYDMGQTMPAAYQYFNLNGGVFYPSTNGLSTQNITNIDIYTTEVPTWSLQLDGTAIGGTPFTMTQQYFAEGIAHHGAVEWADTAWGYSNTYSGMPLWLLCGFVDDANQHDAGAFNDALAASGYLVKVISGTYYKIFSSQDVARSSGFIMANLKNGAELPSGEYPLRLVGAYFNDKKGQSVKAVDKIELLPGNTLTIAASPSGGGTTTPAVGNHTYVASTVVNISATAATGYQFVNWTGDVADPSSSSTTVTMDASKTVTANFSPVTTYQVDVSSSPTEGGSVSPVSGQYYGSTQFTATANAGYQFVNWTINEVTGNTTNPLTLDIQTATTLVANFGLLPTYQVDVSCSPTEGGSVSPVSGMYGGSTEFTATANTGYHFDNWTIGGSVVETANPLTLDIQAATTLVANFQWVLQLDGTAIGGTTYTITQQYFEEGVAHHGALVWTDSWSNSGYTWSGMPLWLLVGYVDDAVQHGDGAFNDTLAASGYLVKVIDAANDSYSTTLASQDVARSNSFFIANLKGGLPLSSSEGPLRLVGSGLTKSKATKQVVKIQLLPGNTLTIAASPSGGGTTTPAVGNHTYVASTVVNISATAATGYQFVNWTGDVADPSSSSTTVTMDASKTVTANFTMLAPSVRTNAAIGITTNSATLNGNLTSLGTASSVDVSFQWGLTDGYGNETSVQTMNAASTFSANIGSLTPGTTYHFTAKAVGDGTSYGDDMTFTTGVTIIGITGEVNCSVLPFADVELRQGTTVIDSTTSDAVGNYTLIAPSLGAYDIVVDKDGWRPQTQQVTISGIGTVTLDFVGQTGLIPNAPSVQYVAQCSNHYLYPYGNCGLTVQRVAAVSNAYLYPVSE